MVKVEPVKPNWVGMIRPANFRDDEFLRLRIVGDPVDNIAFVFRNAMMGG